MSKNKLIYRAKCGNQFLYCSVLGACLIWKLEDDLLYSCSAFSLILKKGRSKVERELSSRLLERGVDSVVIENLIRGG